MEASPDKPQERDIVGDGCVWSMALLGMAFSLFLGCGAGICGVIGLLMTPFSRPSEMPPEVNEALQGPLGPMFGMYLPGGLACGLMMLMLHYGVVHNNLPHSVRGRWAMVTFAGGVAYWITNWLAHYEVLQANLFGLVPLLQQAGRGTQEEMNALAAITAVGLTAGALSGATLGVPQWLVMRGRIAWAGRWLAYVIIASALLVGFFFWGYYWFSHGSSWN